MVPPEDSGGSGVDGMEAIPSFGNAKSTQNSNLSAERNFELFLTYQNEVDPSWPTQILGISEDQANDVKVYERYARWLTFDFESNRKLSPVFGTIKEYVRHIGHYFARRFPTAGTRLRLLDGINSWMTILIDNIKRILAQEAFEDGTKVCMATSSLYFLSQHLYFINFVSYSNMFPQSSQLSTQAPSVNDKMMGAISQGYLGDGTQDAIMRALVLILCFMACGRCGEVAYLDWKVVEWDLALGVAVLMWRDVKNSKEKPVPLLPDLLIWSNDFYLVSAFAAVIGVFNLRASSEGSSFLFEHLKLNGGSVANKITGYLGDMADHSSKSKFKLSMPPNSKEYFDKSVKHTSHGFRHGACDVMQAHGVDDSIITDLSGHAPISEGKGAAKGTTFSTTYHKATRSRTVIG
jgi:integrase